MPLTLSELLVQCRAIRPELILSLTICVVILADMFTPLRRSGRFCFSLGLLGTVVALGTLILEPSPPAGGALAPGVFRGMLVDDGLGFFFRVLFLAGTLAALGFSLASRETSAYRQGEYVTLLLGATLGACFLAASNNFIMFVLALETLSMCSYVLAGYIKHQRHSAEAGLKYVLYGAVASGVMLFGISYLYGLTGTLDIEGGIRGLAGHGQSAFDLAVVMLVMLLLLAGVGFKMAIVPFHFWCPDVYQGAPTPITAYLAVVSKMAGFSALLRILHPLFLGGASLSLAPALPSMFGVAPLSVLFGVLAVVTMLLGNLVAIRQTDVKRLLAYSSIAHAGYLLLGLTVYTPESLQAMLVYFFMYLFMNLGAFWIVIVLVNRTGGAEIERFRGAAYRAPLLAVAMFIFLISLTGVPPTAGFVAKLILFKVVIGAGIAAMNQGAMTGPSIFYFALAFIGVINSAISLYYYMTIVKAMTFEQPDDPTPWRLHALDYAFTLIFAVPTLALIYFEPILKWVETL